jgi:hypothetical protein
MQTMEMTRCQYILGITKGRISIPTISTILGRVR